MRDSSGCKAIKITPDELIFDQVVPNQTYTQQMTLKNNLSAPVDIVSPQTTTIFFDFKHYKYQTLKSSNSERLEVEPKTKKLAPFESCVIDVTIRIIKPFPAKTVKQKDTIFLKSDFFDQKVNVTIIPSVNLSGTHGTTPRDSSLGNSTRLNIRDSSNNAPKFNNKREGSKEAGLRHQYEKDFSPKASFQNMPGLERELELKSTQLINLAEQLEKQELEAQTILQQLHMETQKRKDIEEKLYGADGNSNKEYLEEVRLLLREREPHLEQLMDLTLKKDRDQQERKDAKILEILRQKDKQIEEVQQKAVIQEADYGKLASAFQESKKKIKQLEEENEKQKLQIKGMSSELEQQQTYVSQLNQTEAAIRLKQMEQQFSQASEMVKQLQEQLWQGEQSLNEKTQNEAFYNEAIDRMKNQMLSKDNNLQSIEKDLIYIKEDKNRLEEHIKQLMQQLTSVSQENLNERNLNIQKLKSDHDVIERITRLQDDKTELIQALDQQKRDNNKDNDKLRYILERLSNIKVLNSYSVTQNINTPIADQLASKFEDLARIIREQEDANTDLSNKLKREQDLLRSTEQEFQQVLQENELLQSKVQTKKKVNGTQTQLEMSEIEIMINSYERIKNRSEKLEDQTERLQTEYNISQQKVKQLQNELDKSNQELNMVIRSQQQNNVQADFGYSQSYNNSVNLQGDNNNSDEVISRLNAKITNMKINEERLVQQINQMSTQLQESSQSHSQNRQLQSSISSMNPQKIIGLEERLGEYEIILMQQREQLIKLEEENHSLNQEISQLQRSKENELEQFQIRVKNLNEINKKHEQLSTNRDIRMSTDTGLGFSVSDKSTAAETERMRQYAQQMELNNMGLKHSIESLQIERDQFLNECSELKMIISKCQKENIRLRQDMKLMSVGLNDSEQYVQKISEQKNKIKSLEGLLLRAKQDFDKLGQGNKNSKFDSNSQVYGQKLEDILTTNENLRHENQRVVAALMDIKEEYSNKLHQFSSKYGTERQKLKLENMSISRKFEVLTSQAQYMEKKELRLAGQLEELKRSQSQEHEEKEYRLKELDDLLNQKDEAINELEREIKQKDRSLKERQEQIGVLIDTLENEHSSDDLRQRVLNLSAELCSLKSIEAQQEKRANELFHQLKMLEQNYHKNIKQIDQLKLSKKEIQIEMDKSYNSIFELQNKVQELEASNNDVSKEFNEWKYKCERQELQLSLKEDTILQLREQIRRSENQFKEQINRIRKDFTEKSCTDKIALDPQSNKTLSFKQSVQQLHLVLVDYLQQNVQPAEHLLAQDFEKTLVVASQTIEKLQNALDKSQHAVALLNNDYSALTHNTILINKQELLVTKLQNMELAFNKREDERWAYQKQMETSMSKIIKEQESRITFYEKQYTELVDNNVQLKDQINDIKAQKEELELSVVCFQQEVENQKSGMERNAEITVDERYKAKHEAIRTYFDSNITKILLSQGTSNKFLDLGREICSLKIVIQNLETKLIAGQSDREGLEQSKQVFKNQQQQLETKIRDLQKKLRKSSQSQNDNISQIKIELEKKKQENLQLEKELIKAREIIEEKTRSLNTQQNKAQSYQESGRQESFEEASYKEKLNTALKDIAELQEKIVELRSEHIQEIEECRVQYNIDVAEARRHLNEEKKQLEKRYKPGQAPGDLVEQNNQLKNKVSEMRQALDNISQENTILRKKVESEKASFQNQNRELQAQQQAIQELQFTMIQGNQTSHQSMQFSQTQFQQNPKKLEIKRSNSKSNSMHKKNQQFQNESNEQLGQSKINQQDSSLNVSEMTSMNMINPRLSQSMIGGNTFQGVVTKQFHINPPDIVKALIQSKICEAKASSKVNELVQTETSLRENIKTLTSKLRQIESQLLNRNGKDTSNHEIELQHKRLLELEIENEDLKIAVAQSQINSLQNNYNQADIGDQQVTDVPIQDYAVLIESVLLLSTKLAKQENNQQDNQLFDQQKANIIEQAQRMVIKSLMDQLFVGKSHIDLQYVPSQEQDRKIWYLELLEQQLDSSDQTIKTLQNFIKKLQIEISGNLQSAAQIKASSMNLAQNTTKTSEEIKAVGQIIGLIKYDIQQMMNKEVKQQLQTMQKTVNPFLDMIDPSVTLQQSKNPQYQNLIQINEALQNQLTITERVKKTLEQEIVSLKIAQSHELQQLSNQLQCSSDQRDSLMQNNEELHEKVMSLENHLENLKKEIDILNMSYIDKQHILVENEKEKEQLTKTKTATTKHLQKMQQDLADWRKQTDENMKIKEKQVSELTSINQSMTQERDRLKSENLMLRKNQKERLKGESEEIKRLEDEKEELVDNLSKEIESRKKEIEFWITERATMREMIDQLESDKAGIDIKQGEILGTTEDQLKQIKKKSVKKLKIKDIEIKTKDKQVQDLISELQKIKIMTTKLEHQLREVQTQLSDSEERSRYHSQKQKEVELERDLILAEKNNAISSNDYTAQQIQVELNSLRECFSKLKVERDNLLQDIDFTSQKENDFKITINQLNEDIKVLESQMQSKETEMSAKVRVLEQKNSTLLQDVKYLRQENEKIKQRIKDSDQSILDQESRIHEEDIKLQEKKYQNSCLLRQIQELQLLANQKDQQVQDLQGQIVLVEGSRFKDTEALRHKLQDVKDSHTQVVSLYEAQLDYLKSKFVSDKKISEQKSDQVFTLGQREAVIKSLKKENQLLKISLQKVKAKSKELKLSSQKSENISTNQGNGVKVGIKIVKQIVKQEDSQKEKAISKIAEMLSSDSGFKGMLEQLQKTNELVYTIANYEAECAKMNSQNMVMSQQMIQYKDTNQQLLSQNELLSQKELKETKLLKQSQNQNENPKQYKQEIKTLQAEIRQIKEDWLSPEDFKALQDQLRDQQLQIKAAKDEVQRKREVISTIKLQRDHTENEANQIMQNMEGLKDDNTKQQKILKEHNRNLNAMKELKQNNDYLKTQEKRLKEEINSLNEKLKLAKIDIQRKDTLIKEYKDKLDSIQDEVNMSKDRQNEMEKLKEIVKSNKMDTEIKENQIRAIKQKMKHIEEENEQFRQQSQTNIMSSQNNQQQMDQQVKTSKLKLKKYELYLKKSLEALRKIGKELTQQNNTKSAKKKSQQADNPLMISELDRDMYKDSVNILGVSMDELAEFMNPNAYGGPNYSGQSDARHNESTSFIAKLDKALEIPDTLNQDIDQICNYCVKLINEISTEVGGYM